MKDVTSYLIRRLDLLGHPSAREQQDSQYGRAEPKLPKKWTDLLDFQFAIGTSLKQ